MAAGVLMVVAIALAILATRLNGQSQAGAFVGAGAAVLMALIMGIWSLLQQGAGQLAPVTSNYPLLMSGGAQCRSQSHAQHYDNRPDRHGEFSDCGDECFPTQTNRIRHWRFQSASRILSTRSLKT